MVESSLSGSRVLIVEDEMMISMMLEDMLTDFGCKIVAVSTRPDEAIAVIEAHCIDIAILDVNLNGERSIRVADSLAARGVPFIFSTGYGDAESTGTHRDRPMLRKPFRDSELKDAVSRVLTARSPGAKTPGKLLNP